MTRLNETHWVYGNGAHIYFKGGGDPIAQTPVPSGPSGFSAQEGCAAISDDQEKFLFYTDGISLWDPTQPNTTVTTVPPELGGDDSSTHSSIIVPPAGSGNEYHVFAVGSDHNNGHQITHSSFSVATGIPQVASHPQPIGITSHSDATERLAATSHADCDKYWVAAQSYPDGRMMLFLVEGDVASVGTPTVPPQTAGLAQPWAKSGGRKNGQMKFSPNGELLAYCDFGYSRVVVLKFSASTGVFTHLVDIERIPDPYGLEFSPSSKLLYYSSWDNQTWQVALPGGPQTSTPLLHGDSDWVTDDVLRQLQLGPNDKIYGARKGFNHLAVIEKPDVPGSGRTYKSTAPDATGIDLHTGVSANDGLPTFTRIADKCRTPDCAAIADEVDNTLWDATGEHHESMQPCDYRVDEPGPLPRKRVWPHPKDLADCEPLPFERPEPSVFITHSDSDCDCLESDDVEVMNITVCNPYSNITLTDLTIQSIELVGPNGGPPTPLPDGSPSVTVAPIGPFCFGDVAPCSCVSRQFVMRLRGAVAGTYKLKVTAMCFAWQVSESQQRCFEFEVCAD